MSNIVDKRTAKLKTLLNLVVYLNNHGEVPVNTVCELFGLTTKELAATINEILMCGVPPYGPSDYVTAWMEDGRVAVANADFLRRPLSLTLAEAVSIKVIIDDFIRQSPGVFEDVAAPLAAKLGSLLGRTSTEAAGVATLARKMVVLEKALSESRAVAISYYSRAEDALMERVVEPWATVDIDGVWYLVAFCRLRKAQRSFRIDRIRRATELGDKFSPPEGLDPDEFRVSEMFFPTGEETPVTVRFDADKARWARERFERFVESSNEDGSVVCRFPVADFAWVGDMVTDFAGAAVIVDPPEARAACAKRLDAVLALYEGGQ